MWNVLKVNKQRFQRNIILVSVLLTLNSFHILLLCFRWWLWKNKYQLGCKAHEKLFFTCLVQLSLMILAWYGYIDISRKKYSNVLAWKVAIFGVTMVRNFPNSDWIQTRITPNTDNFYSNVVPELHVTHETVFVGGHIEDIFCADVLKDFPYFIVLRVRS